MKKAVTNKKAPNLYGNFHPADSAFLNKIDAKMADLRKNNKKYPLEFYDNAKKFVLNAINAKKKDRLDALPKTLANLVGDRNIDKLYQDFIADTKNIGKVLFSQEMSLEEICACAVEYVRVCSSNFDKFNGEGARQAQSELAESVSKSYNGIISLYFGVADDADRGQLLARLINVGLDTSHKIAYAECIVDIMNVPICQIVDFSGKPAIAISCYNGVAKTYTNNVKKLSNMYQFLDFNEHIPMARKRAIKTLIAFHNFKLVVPRTSEIEKTLVGISQNAIKNLSKITASEMNLLVNVDKKVFKVATLIEVALYERQIEYEVLPDLFEENLYSFKFKMPRTRIKVFPNKIVDNNYNLTESSNYIWNRGSKDNDSENNSVDEDSTSTEINDIGDYSESNFSSNDDILNQKNDTNFDNITPVPAAQVLENLKVKFRPPENENEFLLDGSRIKFTQKQIEQAMYISPLELENIQSVNMDMAEKERQKYEEEVGEFSDENWAMKNDYQTSDNKKKKSFYDKLDEIADIINKNRTKKLQKAYENFEQNGELNYNQDKPESASNIEEEKQSNLSIQDNIKPIKENEKDLNTTIQLKEEAKDSKKAENLDQKIVDDVREIKVISDPSEKINKEPDAKNENEQDETDELQNAFESIDNKSKETQNEIKFQKEQIKENSEGQMNNLNLKKGNAQKEDDNLKDLDNQNQTYIDNVNKKNQGQQNVFENKANFEQTPKNLNSTERSDRASKPIPKLPPRIPKLPPKRKP